MWTINISNGGCKKKIIGCKRISDICGSIVMKNFDNQQEPEKQSISSGTKYFIIKKQTVGEPVMLHKSKYLRKYKILSKLRTNLKIKNNSKWTLPGSQEDTSRKILNPVSL